MTRYYRVKVVLAVLTAAACISMASTSLPMCTEGEEDNCATCYDVLASQAVTSAKNRYNLQQAFFPPRRENPVLLEVIYKFDVNTTNGPIDESLNSSEVWFWTDSGFYLYQPLDVIQLTSLFFADYSLRRSKVILHLRQDCRGASEKHMELFTQRVRNIYVVYTHFNRKHNSTATYRATNFYLKHACDLQTIILWYIGLYVIWFWCILL